MVKGIVISLHRHGVNKTAEDGADLSQLVRDAKENIGAGTKRIFAVTITRANANDKLATVGPA